jgi:hypothetical protein
MINMWLCAVALVGITLLLVLGDQEAIDRSCLDNGGIVTKYERYRTCSIPKGVYTKESKMKHTSH